MIGNRAERREMARQLKRRGREVVVLRGGPMADWVVATDAPALRADWYTTWPPSVTAAHQPGVYELRAGEATAFWRELR